ncbi:beta-lactamase family protein [Duganella sp. BJB1802]|uniref:serine hydrolase domain-containing protein n=1 Tax=Duganella sp. BJB1802 TaxID=2744575 RepID=UPI0015930611|nr:serine hydrolase domain-containing protein [Duganella sp. BJB1802]NVD73151.1 beta-lactamase family protein [Duganella sp. BJB1802]
MRITSPIILAALLLAGCAAGSQRGPTVDIEMQRLMAAAKVPGLALAVIDHGQVVSRHAYGYADVAAARPLRTDSIMYGASLTKAAFAYMVMQLVDERVLTLDAPLPTLLDKPLPDYPAFADLRDDPRWRLLTPRMLLSHTSGLLNWRFINENRKLDFKYPPGSRYVYSGEGMQILQIVVEERTGVPLETLMRQRVFERFGMRDTSMVWRDDFAGREVVHYGGDGAVIAHKRRSRARAAGSMDTTLDDYASFMAGVLRGDGLSAAARAEMLSPQMAIVSPQQFPSHWPGETDAYRGIGLSAGLGWPVYESPLGPAFFKEGNDDGTNNFALGFLRPQSGVVMLSNSSNADRMFLPAVEYLFGRTCLPWFWMGYIPYDRPELRAPGMRAHPVLSPGCD